MPESCPKNGDVPKSPLSPIGSAGAVGRHNNTPSRVAFGSGAVSTGAIASMVIGFSWGGWMTGGTAIKLADERANTAVVAALTPICVEKFLQNSDAKANLAVLQKISSHWELR